MMTEKERRLSPIAQLESDHIRVHEIYASIQGESSWAGVPCVFVRTTACHLRCRYCDTPHAFGQGESKGIDQVIDEVRAYGVSLVEVTGGEPLLQVGVLSLMSRLCDFGHTVLLETSGSLPIHGVDERVCRIVDMKAPSSGEVEANCYANLEVLRAHDEIKFVIADRRDYDWACDLMLHHRLSERCTVLMGVVYGALDNQVLVEWIMTDRLKVRFQLQLHKHVWDSDSRGV